MPRRFGVLNGNTLRMTVFFFNDTATTEIYTLSLHDALPISIISVSTVLPGAHAQVVETAVTDVLEERSEEHTSELQSHSDLVCRLLLEKKKQEMQVIGIDSQLILCHRQETGSVIRDERRL